MIAALLWGAWCGTEVVSIETPAMSAAAVVAAVADKTGRKLAVDRGLSNEVLFLKVDDVEVDDLLTRIATVADGKWIDRDGVSTLIYNPNVRAAALASVQARRAALMEECLKKLEKVRKFDPDNYGDGDDTSKEDLARYEAAFNFEQFQNRCLTRAVRQMGLRRLSTVGPGGHMMFSDHPTAAQLPLDIDWRSLYALAQQSDEYYYDDRPAPSGLPDYASKFADLAHDFDAQTPDFEGQPVKLLIWVDNDRDYEEASEYISMPDFSVYAIDRNGMMKYVANFDLESAQWQDYGDESMGGSEEGDDEETDTVEPEGHPLKLTAGDRLIGDYDLPPATRARILASFADTAKDPLDLIAGTLLRRMGEAGGVDVVAEVPDDLVGLRGMLDQEGESTPTFEWMIKYIESRYVNADLQDGWLMVHDHVLATNRNVRLDRASLSEYVEAAGDGPQRLDEEAKFFFRNPFAEDNALFVLLQDVIPTCDTEPFDADDIILQVWGSLSDNQRKRLRDGGTVRISELSKESRERMAQLVYDEDLVLEPPMPSKMADYDLPSQSMLREMVGDDGSNSFSSLVEPTEGLPNGLPGDGVLSLAKFEQPCFVYSGTSADPNEFGVINAFTVLSQEDDWKNGPRGWAEQPSLPQRAKLGTQTTLGLTIRFTPAVQASGWLFDVEVLANAPTVDPSAPTGEMREAINRILNQTAAFRAYQQYRWDMDGSDEEDPQKPPP
jgi:hypothetical protein